MNLDGFQSNKSQGFIKLFRSFLKWEWYDDANTVRLLIHCLLRANHETTKWRGLDIPRGSFVTSYGILSSELKLSIQKIRTSLNKLTSTNEITYKSTRHYSIITINNYDIYQEKQHTNQQTNNKQRTDNQQTNNKQRTDNQQTNNNKQETKEVKKQRSKEIKNNIKSLFHKLLSTDEELQKSENLKPIFEQWLDYKAEIKKQYKGEIGLRTAFKNFIDLSQGNVEQAQKLVDYAIAKGWGGIYPIKNENNKNSSSIDSVKSNVDWESRSL